MAEDNYSNHKFREHQQAAIKSISNEIDILGKMVIQGDILPDIESVLGRLQGIINRAKASSLVGVEQKTLFHERIDAHFSELSVSNYKRLQNLRISKLSRINLFTGINNSGKTTLLEAVYLLCRLLCRQNDFFGLLEVIRRRGKMAEDRINPEWFIEQIPEIEISGQFDHADSYVRIKHYKEENSKIDKSFYLESVEISSRYATTSLKSLTRIFKGRDRETQADRIALKFFVHPFLAVLFS